jgi:hypothetical protein
MKQTLQFGGTLLVCAVFGLSAQAQKEVPGSAPPRGVPVPAAKPGPGGAANKAAGGTPKGVHLMGLPGENPLQRLLLVSPEQRELAIEKLPAGEQTRAHRIFDDFDRRNAVQKQEYLRTLNRFWSLPDDKQTLVRERRTALNQLPDERREILLAEWRQLSRLPDDERRALIASDVFKHKYSSEEQQILSDLSEYYPAQGR